MKCKKHFSDVSSSVGVCASCLRERLLFLIDAQSQAHHRRLTPPDDKLHQQQIPVRPPIVFPSSVSPYISRRKSDASSRDADLSEQLRQRFFSTPQVVPTANKKKSKFNVISKLFRSRSTKSAHPMSDPATDPSFPVSNSGKNAGDRKISTLGLFSLDETSAYDGRRGRWFGSRNRGMSPDVREDESDERSLSPEQWKRTPSSARGSNRTGQARVKASPARSHVVSGIGICLSPLMRPSPSRIWKGVGPGGAAEAAYSGEIRSTVMPHLSTAASLRANRSRKLADLGRFNHNR